MQLHCNHRSALHPFYFFLRYMIRIKFKHDHWLFQVESVFPNIWAGASHPSNLLKVSELKLQKLTFFCKVSCLFLTQILQRAFLFFSKYVIGELEGIHDYLLSILNLHTKLEWLPCPDFCRQDRSSLPSVAVTLLVACVIFQMFSAGVKISASIISQPSLIKIPDPGNKWVFF